ncbi:hypothetical protein SAMN04487787_11682 [Kosakonia sacchari]|nr:hypothetical protein SAMN04487787_11682 [Kosakonia sacchari]
MGVAVNFRRENFMASLLFSLISWALLYYWLCIMHSIGEKVASTILSSSLIRALIITAVFSFIIQKRSGVLRDFAIITSGIIFIFLSSIAILNLILKTTSDFYDLIFYYECFLLVFFCITPIHLLIRMI